MLLPPNFRDVATITNEYSKRVRIRPHTLYRSSYLLPAHLPSLPPLTTNLDLRTDTEREQARAPRDASSPSHPRPSFATTHHPVLSRRYKLHLLRLLPVPQLLLLLLHLLLSILPILPLAQRQRQRIRATSKIGAHVLAPLGLAGISILSLTYSSAELVGVLRALTRREAYPACVSCTAGKDRTGMVVLLVMLLLGVEEDVVVREYARSDEEVMREGDEGARRVREEMMRVGGLGIEFCRAPEEVARRVVDVLRERWGGAEGWAEEIGFARWEREELRRVLLVDAGEDGSVEVGATREL